MLVKVNNMTEKCNLLTQSRDYYKPFVYPWAYEAFMQSEQMHWLWTEVPMVEDVKDWKMRLNDNERDFLTKVFRFFTQGDIDGAGVFYNDAIDESSWKLTDTYWTADKLDQPYFTYLGDEGIDELMDNLTFDPPESPLDGAANIREYKHELLAPYHERYAKALLDWSIGNSR